MKDTEYKHKAIVRINNQLHENRQEYGERRKHAINQGEYANDKRHRNLKDFNSNSGRKPTGRHDSDESSIEDALVKDEPTEEEMEKAKNDLKPVQIIQTQRQAF